MKKLPIYNVIATLLITGVFYIMLLTHFIMQNETLQDVSPSGRFRPWRETKMANEHLHSVYKILADERGDKRAARVAERLANCATELVFAHDANDRRRLIMANFCRVRLCPVCQWRRSLKLGAQMHKIMHVLSRENYAFCHLVISRKNAPLENLAAEIDALLEGWHRLSRLGIFQRAVKGYYRALEITINADRSEFHPHFHIILVVNKSYFTSRDYISREKWIRLWRRSVRVDYDPHVFIKKIVAEDIIRGVAEVTKYSVKAADYVFADDLDLSADVVAIIDPAIQKRRFVSFGGCVKDAARELRLQDVEDRDVDLVHLDDDDETIFEPVRTSSYLWMSGITFGDYYRTETDFELIVPKKIKKDFL